MVASRQVLTNQQQRGDLTANLNAPKFAALVVSCRVIYLVFVVRGVWFGLLSVVMSAMCVSPLFNYSLGYGQDNAQQTVGDDRQTDEHQTSSIFAETEAQELEDMIEEEYSTFGRLVHRTIESWSEDVEELVYVAQVLRENQGLLILLVGGVSSMVMALLAGLDDVNVIKALVLSITCYGITTVLVARSARQIGHPNALANGEPILSSSDVKRIVEAIPEEKFVPNDELEKCSLRYIIGMLNRRRRIGKSPATCPNKTEMDGPLDAETVKKDLMLELKQKRNYNESCCICLSQFATGERIKVLHHCHHEFHSGCIGKWAQTFASNRLRMNCNTKSGKPTCPLCNTCLGGVPICSPMKP